MTTPSPISHTVLRRVRRIHVMRTVTPPIAAAGVFAGALWGIGREVWVARVLENMPSLSEGTAAFAFLMRAFAQTEFLVQLCTLLAMAAALWLAYAGARSLATPISYA